MRKLAVGVSLYSLALVAGCGSSAPTPPGGAADLSVVGHGDLAGPSQDMTGQPPADMVGQPAVDMTGQAAADMTGQPPADMTGKPADMAMQPPVDMAVPAADMVVVRDLLAPPDLVVIPDLTKPADLAVPPADLAGPPLDMTGQAPPDLAGGLAAFVVLRVGDGMAALASVATPVFIQKHGMDGSQVMGGGFPAALPTAANGNNQPCTLSGSSTSEGSLSRSADTHYLALGCYAAVPGTAAVAATASMATNRIVARIAAAGTVDTTTHLPDAYDGTNIRSATSVDGTAFWMGGASGGVRYATFGAAGSTQILAAPSNVRVVHVFGGQLYGSSQSGAFVSVYSIGAGTPTMAGQMATTLPGLPNAAGPSPYSYALFDLDPNVAGLDTLYLSDDRSTAAANTGGVQKWAFDGMTWKIVTTFTNGLATGVRGLAASAAGNVVSILAVTTEGSANNVVMFVDDGQNMNPKAAILTTAPANTAFRGVDFAPN